MKTVRTNSTNKDFIKLVKMLDQDLAVSDGDLHSFYSQYNKIDKLKYVVLVYIDEIPLGCGAIKEYSLTDAEVKRMYTKPEFRGKGVASKILLELEHWARELNYDKCILETGKRQPEAIALYKNRGYKIIRNYGQYFGVNNSVCFEKDLNN